MATNRSDNKQSGLNAQPIDLHLVRYDVDYGRFVVGKIILAEDLDMPMSPELDAVQRLIITRHRELFDEGPSPMKLQKLCYYAQGYLLAQGVKLFDEDFQAWQHGPVVPALYQQYKEYGWRCITEDVAFNEAELTADVVQEIKDIVAAYGRFDGAALSTMTHREAPWIEARGDLSEDQGSTEAISKDSLLAYFRTKLAGDGKQ